MSKIYSVMIKGRTLEGRDLRQLLARAVAEKRSLDRKSLLKAQGLAPAAMENPAHACRVQCPAAVQ